MTKFESDNLEVSDKEEMTSSLVDENSLNNDKPFIENDSSKAAKPLTRVENSSSSINSQLVNYNSHTSSNFEFRETVKTDQNVLVDVLPSFQFYESLVKFIPEDVFDSNASSFPSTAEENNAVSSNYTTSRHLNPPEYDFTFDATNCSRSNYSGRSSSLQTLISRNEQCRYEVDKLHALKQQMSSQLEIKLILTKAPVNPNTVSVPENLLKEYSSGELICGYVTVLNKSTSPLKFEGFYVSLEGIINVKNQDSKEGTVMRFLKAHDLSATWSYGKVELAYGGNYLCDLLDKTDNTELGLPNDKLLQPKTKYKKYFCFKIPKEILDNNCKHLLPEHLSLPPSFGIERNDFNSSYIKINNLLGYGHSGYKGSPLLLPDLSSYDEFVSSALKKNLKSNIFSNKLRKGFSNQGSNISYNVNCKLVLKNKDTSIPYVLNNTVYNIRVVPNTLSSNQKHLNGDSKSTLVDIEETTRFLSSLNTKAIKKIDRLDTLLKKLDHWEDLSLFNIDDLKIQQEEEKLETYKMCPMQPVEVKAPKDPQSGFDCYQYKTEVYLSSNNKNPEGKKSKLVTGLFSLNSLQIAGKINKDRPNEYQNIKVVVETFLNKNLKALPYYVSKYYSNQNLIETKGEINKKVWLDEVIPQLPVSVEEYELKSLPLKITVENRFKGAFSIKKINATLYSHTKYTKRACPVILDANFLNKKKEFLDQIIFNCNENVTKIKLLKDSYIKYQDRLKEVLKHLNLSQNFVTFESFFDREFYSDLEALATLKIEEFEMANVFKDTVIPPEHLLKWVSISDDKIQCELDVNLNYRDDLMLAILPTFDTCLISRFYHLQVECEFSNGQTATLKVPVDVKHFK